MKNKNIPNGWEEKKVEDFGKVLTGTTPKTSNKEYYGNNYFWVTPTDINNKYVYKTDRKLSEVGFKVARKIPANSVLITCIASIGKNTILKEEGSCNQQINAIIPNEKYWFEYLYYLFENSKEKLTSIAGKSATAIINLKTFKNIKFLVPAVEEQRRIADILGECDRVIELKQKLISEEEKRKKYLMSVLLRPDSGVRLPGFSEPWKSAKLGELCEIKSNGVDKKIIENEQKVYLLNFMDVYNNNYIYKNIPKMLVSANNIKIKDCNVLKGDIFITPSSEIREELAFSSVIMEDIPNCCYSYHIMRLRPFNYNFTTSLFISYCFKENNIHNQICEKGTGDIRCVISKKDIENLYIKLPCIEEQKAIAVILSCQDSKIDLLKKELEEWKTKKKSLMQLLLTGLVRTGEKNE